MDSQPGPEQAPVWLMNVAARNGLALEAEQIQTLGKYVALLLEWNSRVNLISRKDQDQVWTSHILHSLSPLFFFEFPQGADVLDLGTGGGLPGIPLAIARPDIHLLLVDSIRKKVAALEAMLPQLPIGNVQVLTSRAEDLLTGPEKKRRFDIVLTRAVAPLEDLLSWTKGLYSSKRTLEVKRRRQSQAALQTPLLLALKGGDLELEIQQARRRFPAVRIREYPLQFDGSAEAGLEGKKMLVAQLKELTL